MTTASHPAPASGVPPASRESLFAQLLDLRRCVPCVVDTNVLAFDVIYSHRHQRRTAMVAASATGSGPVFAAEHVFGETKRLLVTQAERLRIPPADLYATWDRRYANAVRFVDVPPIGADPRLDAVERDDPDDAPNAALALLIAPAYGLSRDPDLVAAGLATPEGLLVAVALNWMGTVDSAMIGTTGTAALVWRGVDASVRQAIAHPRVTSGAFLVAAGSLAVLYAWRGSRLIEDARRIAATSRAGGRQALVIFDELMTEEHVAAAAVQDKLIERSGDGPLFQVAAASARKRFPISVSAIAAETGLARSVVSETLRSSPAFARAGRGWQLGRSGLMMGS